MSHFDYETNIRTPTRTGTGGGGAGALAVILLVLLGLLVLASTFSGQDDGTDAGGTANAPAVAPDEGTAMPAQPAE